MVLWLIIVLLKEQKLEEQKIICVRPRL